MDPSIHTLVQSLDETHAYLLEHQATEGWRIWQVETLIDDLDTHGQAVVNLTDAATQAPRTIPVARDEAPRITFAHGPNLERVARQKVESVAAARAIQERIDTDSAPRTVTAYAEPVLQLATGLYAALLAASWRYGVQTDDWADVHPLGSLALDLAVRVRSRPEISVKGGQD